MPIIVFFCLPLACVSAMATIPGIKVGIEDKRQPSALVVALAC